MSRPVETPEQSEGVRRRIVKLTRQGEGSAQCVRVPGVHRSSVARWRVAADRSSDVAALPHPPPHRRDAQFSCLDGLLAQGVEALRWLNRLGTTPRVGKLIQWRFGIDYHPNLIGRFFCQRLGWSIQWPRRRAHERDDEAIGCWQADGFPRLAREARRHTALLAFLGPSGFLLTQAVRRTSAPRGCTPVVDA